MRSKTNTGFILVLIGIFFLAKQLNWLPGEIPIVAVIGFGFLVMYFTRGGRNNYQNIGVLIPGAILLSVGLSAWIQPIYQIDHTIALGIGFLLIYLLHTVHFTSVPLGKQHWPLIPAIIFFAQGTTNFFDYTDIFSYWPVVLIIIGITMMFQNKQKNRTKQQEEEQDYIDYRQNH